MWLFEPIMNRFAKYECCGRLREFVNCGLLLNQVSSRMNPLCAGSTAISKIW